MIAITSAHAVNVTIKKVTVSKCCTTVRCIRVEKIWKTVVGKYLSVVYQQTSLRSS